MSRSWADQQAQKATELAYDDDGTNWPTRGATTTAVADARCQPFKRNFPRFRENFAHRLSRISLVFLQKARAPASTGTGRASGHRCCTRTSQAASLAVVNRRVASARYLADEATQTTSEAEPAKTPRERPPKGSTKIITKKFKWIMKRPENIRISADVLSGMSRKQPILGLETAIYTHGFPKPNNFDLAMEMEEMVRANGAIPATIGILNGEIYIGMTKDQLKELAESAGSEKTIKVSQRDIAYTIGQMGPPLNGGTTIAATIQIAALSGIRVVATGGLGGVHKGGESSMDVSADLAALGRLKINLVTSGMKSFLDTARTMEYLETQGVFVSTFGTRGERVDIPGFYSRESGYRSPHIVESAEEAARIAFSADMLKLTTGNVFFNPIPKEYEIPKSEMDPIIESAVEKFKSVTGKDNTPAVLNEILKETEGRSIEANRQLVLDNAKIGAQVAVHIRKFEDELVNTKLAQRTENAKRRATVRNLKKSVPPPKPTAPGPSGIGGTPVRPSIGAAGGNPAATFPDVSGSRSHSTTPTPPSDWTIEVTSETEGNVVVQPSDMSETGGVLVVGGVGVDYVGTFNDKAQAGASMPGNIKVSVGGVAKNIAATIQQIGRGGTPVRFLSAIGKDSAGLLVLRDLKRLGLSVQDIQVKEKSNTTGYMALNERKDGKLVAALSDAQIIYNISPERVVAAIEKHRPEIVCFDLNLHMDTIAALCKSAKANGAIVVCEPTSAAKVHKLGGLLQQFEPYPNHYIDILAPNELEFRELERHFVHSPGAEPPWLPQGRVYEGLLNTTYCQTLKRFVEDFHSRIAKNHLRRPSAKILNYLMRKGAALLPAIPTVLIKLGGGGVVTIRAVKNPDPETITEPKRYALYQNITDTRPTARGGPQLTPDSYVAADLFLPVPYNPDHHILGIAINWTAAHPVPRDAALNSNGAGDTFLGAFVQGLHAREERKAGPIAASPWLYYEREYMRVLIHKGQQAAVETLQSAESHYVAPDATATASANVSAADAAADDMWERAVDMFGELEISAEEDERTVDEIPVPRKKIISQAHASQLAEESPASQNTEQEQEQEQSSEDGPILHVVAKSNLNKQRKRSQHLQENADGGGESPDQPNLRSPPGTGSDKTKKRNKLKHWAKHRAEEEAAAISKASAQNDSEPATAGSQPST
ncbi:Pseudouridine-5'-phosphate glycosidase [Drechslerella dactyloides]|uniref:Pseudouridine-5'-phosphate glycosidase n=1 Tax=Drechslerella dactyloides TaxID=74499 RepID=A0AAD6IXP0_DREDA|nr:Pseudouridine-5'-phosphate glycosidase [Drechslerella dactyloides]